MEKKTYPEWVEKFRARNREIKHIKGKKDRTAVKNQLRFTCRNGIVFKPKGRFCM